MEFSEVVREVACETAVEFMEAISPIGKHLQILSPDEEWFFRGHGNDEEYKLIPSALRPKEADRLYKLAELPDADRNLSISQVQAEFIAIEKFFKLADEIGLPLPEDSQQLRTIIDVWRVALFDSKRSSQPQSDDIDVWPPDELLSLIGLAQHSGISTRLLDWSRSPWVAAYFAAKDAIAGGCADGHLSVWAVGQKTLDLTVWVARLRKTYDAPPVTVVTVPRAANPRLHAQSGLFFVWNQCDLKETSCLVSESLEQIISRAFGASKLIGKHAWFPYHFTVPRSEAGKILWLLAKQRVTTASIYPGYDGIKTAMEEKETWVNPFPSNMMP